MATRFFCSTCGKQFEVADSLIGHKVRCTGCGGETRVPARAAPAATAPAAAPSALPAGIPVGKPVEAAKSVTGLPVGKPLQQPAAGVPAAAMPPAAAEPAQQSTTPAAGAAPASQSDEEQYELVYDDLPAKPAAPARPLPQGLPTAAPPAATTTNPASISQPAQPVAPQARAAIEKPEEENYELIYDDEPGKSAAPAGRPTASGMPVGQPIQATLPQGLPVGKPAQAKQTPSGVPVGKPVQSAKQAPPAAAAAPTAAVPTAAEKSTVRKPGAQAAAKPKSPSNIVPRSPAPDAPVGKAVQPASRPSEPAAAAAPAAAGLPDLVLTDAIVDAFAAPELGGEIADVGRRCPRCLTRLSANSNVCPQCGFDSTESEPIPQELPPEMAEAHASKRRSSGNPKMRAIRLALYLVCVAQFLVLIAVILQLIAMLGDEPLSFEAPSPLALVTAGFAGVGFVCSCLSSVLCLLVPKRTGARGMVYLKGACDAITVALIVALTENELPGKAALLIIVLPVVSVLLFIFFMKKLAMAVERDEYVQSVQMLFWKALGFVTIITLLSLFSAGVGSESFLFARIVGVAGWTYVLFNFTLLAQQLGHAELPPEASERPDGEKAASA